MKMTLTDGSTIEITHTVNYVQIAMQKGTQAVKVSIRASTEAGAIQRAIQDAAKAAV